VEETVFRWGPFGPEDFKKHLDQLMDFLKAKLPSVEFIWLTNPMGKYKQFFYGYRQMRSCHSRVMSSLLLNLLYIKGLWMLAKFKNGHAISNSFN
jgi:hypothetical protein